MKMRLSRIVSLLVVGILLGSLVPLNLPTSPTARAQESLPLRWIVRLSEPPLAQAPGIPRNQPYAIMEHRPTSTPKLQLDSPEALRYRQLLQQRQTQVFQTIQQTFPAARLDHTYQIVFNGFSVALPGQSDTALQRLQAMPGVAAVYPEQVYEPLMYASLPTLNTEALWENPVIGGKENAGAGIKVAVIDTGIKVDNPFFNPESFTYPPDFPKGETEHTTPKVIVARAYFRPDLSPITGSETPQPGPLDSSHGTHVGGTIAGLSDTVASSNNITRTISGMAPRAYLMNYKAFYENESVFSGQAFETELIAALEDAVADGADVINNSWGGRANLDPHFDPIAIAANAAGDAGVIVVFSAGNSGPNESTADSTDFTNKLIMVGATTTNQTIAAGFVDVTAPAGAPDTIVEKPYAGADFGEHIFSAAFGPAPYVPVATLGVSALACEPLPPDSLTGKIALMERGICHFSLKAAHAQDAGAIGAMIYNSEEDGEGLISMGGGDRASDVTIPSVFVQRSTGVGMIEWYATHGDAAEVQIDPTPRIIEMTPDVVANFSSRGPTFQGTLKPDVLAPGVNILSSGYADGIGSARHMGFGLSSGTSMAAPHVSGAVALLKQAHPDWSPLDVKSALMSTAHDEIWQDQEQTERAGILERGAGRVDLGRAANPGLLFDPPSLSFGRVTLIPGEPSHAEMTVTARNVAGTPQTFSVRGQSEEGESTISVAPQSLTVAPGESAQFQVAIDLPAGAVAGDYTGQVILEGPQTLHMPLWARALPPRLAERVLLIDNDGSSSIEEHHYADYYYQALTELGVPVDYHDADAQAPANQTLPDISELQRYPLIIWFTGDNIIHDGDLTVPTPLTNADQDTLMAYLQSGGHLIATGQDLTEASDIEIVPPDPHYGRSDLYHYYLGARYVQDNVFDGLEGVQREVIGTTAQPWLAGVTLDLSMLGGLVPGAESSAGNQHSVDEVTVIDPDPRSPDEYTTPILRIDNPFVQDSMAGIVGLNRFSDPTLEEPVPAFDYRTTYLSFGLEGVRNDTGSMSREDFLWLLISWHLDQPSVTINTPDVTVAANQTVDFAAEARSNMPTTFVRYRWDFGDGTPIQETTEPTVSHQYAQAGTYHVRVEAIDHWGHHAISDSPTATPTAAPADGTSATGADFKAQTLVDPALLSNAAAQLATRMLAPMGTVEHR